MSFLATILDEPHSAVAVTKMHRPGDSLALVLEFAPVCLMPGDVVRLDGSTITDVVKPAHTYWLTVSWAHPTPMADVRGFLFQARERHGVTAKRSTALTVELQLEPTNGNVEWMLELNQRIGVDLEHVELRRRPVRAFDLAAALQAERV